MPIVRPSGAPEPPRSHARVARTESLKSERSDKRVSFNKDVGVKHIPRGQKNQQQTANHKNNVVIRAPPSDEWAKCSEVYREPVNLSSQELEKQAQEIVKLLDNINCDSAPNSLAFNTRSLDRPSHKKNNSGSSNNKNVNHQNYNNVVINNNVRNNNKNTNVINGEPRGRPRTLPTSRTANPINRKVKGDVNRVQSPSPIPNGGPLAHHRHRSADHLPDTDLDTPPLPRRAHHLAAHKSVPDLNTVYYDNKDVNNYQYKHVIDRDQDPRAGYKSVDNLYDGDEEETVISFGNSKVGYKSVDNLTEGNQVSSRRLQGFKSVGHLPSVALSDTDTAEMTHREQYRPKVGNIIKKFNMEAEGVRRGPVMMDMGTEMEAGHRGTLEPDRYRSHNNNQPFSYTGTAPLASVQAVRRLSPPRDLPRPSPPRESPARDLPVYAQVSKRDGRAQTNGRREVDRNYRNARQEREYSAKIIITDSDIRHPYQEYDDHSPYRETSPKNNYRDEDDDAYESYQVPEDNLRRLLHDDLMPQRMLSSEDLFDEYKELSNNNINMSSVGVQTDALPKAPSRSRKTSKSPAPSPTRQVPSQVQKQQMQRHQQSHNHHHATKKQEFGHHQNSRSQKQQDYSVNHHSGSTIHNNLTSASLVRQVNHGFGRTDRSPSPPPRVSASRQPRRNVVPLLSDTSDSEAEHRRPPFDPLARIRDQVMQREKLQEEEEEEEEEARHGRIIKDSSVMPYKTEEMTPLTIDEVDALSLIMEDTGRKTLVVSNQAQSNTVTRVSNHRSRRSETVTEQVHSHNAKDSLPRPQKPPREKNHVPREPTPTRKEPSTLEKNKKNNIEKERANKAAKQKEEKKEKKKKRIKIKFFYDPRPQDDPSVDPLARFTEFRGSSSEERNSPRDERDDPRRDRKEEMKDDYHNERITSQREEYHSDRRERDDYRHRRGLPDVLEDTTDGMMNERRSSASRERLDSTPRPNKRGGGSREVVRDSKSHESLNTYNNRRRDSKDSKDSKDNRTRESRSRSRDDHHVSYDESADERRNYERNERSVDRDYSDNDERGSPDGRPGRSLSDKYRSGPLYDPPDAENSPSPEIPVTEEDEKQQKILRQRKKFFSVLRSDGRSSSPPKSIPPKSKSSPLRSNKKGPAPTHPPASSPSGEKAKEKTPAKKKPAKKKRAWPWALLGLRGGGRGQSQGSQAGVPASTRAGSSRVSSRASSRASSRSSHRPRRPSVRASKIHREAPPPAWYNREREEIDEGSPPPSQQWESSTLNRAELRARKDNKQGDSRGYSTTQRATARKYSAESSASSGAPPPQRVARTTSFKHRYFGDTDIESNRGGVNTVPDYRSLPNRASRSAHKNAGKSRRIATGPRGMSPPVVGSAGSSLQSSESEVDSHGGSHASRASKASHVSTGSNRSVYLHATAVADIPVRRGQDEAPSERGISRQTKKVSRSFSVLAPWKPRHHRERYEVDYENHEAHDNKGEANNSKGALPPRPPRRQANDSHDKKVNRSQSMYKDSRLAGWLRRRKHKEAKGI